MSEAAQSVGGSGDGGSAPAASTGGTEGQAASVGTTIGAPTSTQGDGSSQTKFTEGTQTGDSTSSWTSGLNEDLRGYVENKGFKDPAAVVDSYRNMEKLMGVPKDRLVKLPEDVYDPEQMTDVYNKLGRPEKPEDYQLEFTDEPEEFQQWSKELFHEAGLNSKQAQRIMDKMNEYSNQMRESSTKEMEARVAQEQKDLQRDWGKAFEQNTRIAKSAARELGIDEPTVNAITKSLGYKKTMELFHKIGESTMEAGFHDGNAPEGVLTPDAAKNKIAMLRADKEFANRYVSGDIAARKEMERLHELAYVQ